MYIESFKFVLLGALHTDDVEVGSGATINNMTKEKAVIALKFC